MNKYQWLKWDILTLISDQVKNNRKPTLVTKEKYSFFPTMTNANSCHGSFHKCPTSNGPENLSLPTGEHNIG